MVKFELRSDGFADFSGNKFQLSELLSDVMLENKIVADIITTALITYERNKDEENE